MVPHRQSMQRLRAGYIEGISPLFTVLYTLCTNKEPTTKKASRYGNANKTSMATPDKALLKRILGVRSSTKGSIMIVRLNSATIGLGIINLKQEGI